MLKNDPELLRAVQDFENDIQPFLDGISPYQSLWHHLVLWAAIGRKNKDAPLWSLLALRITLSAEAEQHQVLIDTDLLRIVQGSLPLPPGSFDPLINLIGPFFRAAAYRAYSGSPTPFADVVRAHRQGGSIGVTQDTWRQFLDTVVNGGQVVTVGQLDTGGFQNWKTFFWREPIWLWPDADVPYSALQGSGRGISELIDAATVQSDLYRKYGYARLEHFPPGRWGTRIGLGAFNSIVQIVAPIPLHIQGELERDVLSIQVTAPQEVERSALQVKWKTMVGDHPTPEVPVDLTNCREKDAGEHRYQLSCELPIDPGVTQVDLQLFYGQGRDPVDIATCHASRDPVWLAFSKLTISGGKTPSLDRFWEDLGLGTTPNQHHFEVAVSNLFALQGLLALYPGLMQTEGVDVIVSAPDFKAVLLVSVTMGNNIQDKVRTLLPIHSQVGSILPRQWQVRGIIVTAVSSKDIPRSQRDEAFKNGIKILTREDLQNLFEDLRDHGPRKARKGTLRLCGLLSDAI